MSWDHPSLLALAPVAAALLSWLDAARRARLHALLAALGARAPAGREGASRTLLAALAACCTVAALAGPRLGRAEAAGAPATPSGPETAGVPRGRALVLLVDASRSMSVADVAPDRATAARLAALRLAAAPAVGRVGLVAFAAEAHLLVPPTSDLGLVTVHLDGLDPGALTGQGTDLAGALHRALDALEEAPGRGEPGSVVVFSDGEGFEDEAELDRALARAVEAGVAVHGVLAGTADGGVVPGEGGGAVSRARAGGLEALARATGGRTATAGDGRSLAALAAALSGERGREAPLPPEATGPLSPLASALALAAALLLMAEAAAGPPRWSV